MENQTFVTDITTAQEGLTLMHRAVTIGNDGIEQICKP